MKTRCTGIVASIVFLLILVTSSTVVAQSRFGIRGGLNASNISFKNLPDRGERYGFHLGVFADVPVVADFMSIQPELSYSTKGTSFKPLDKRQTLNMNYVDFLLPVAFHLGALDIQVGPFASFLISTPDYTVYNDNSVVVDAFNKFDAGLSAGLSYNFNKLMIGLRFNQGFVDVTKDNARLFLGSGKNAVGQVSLGFKF
jgi:Outer membrane protein beta-barrel domain